jgi:uncharacterized membrane protein
MNRTELDRFAAHYDLPQGSIERAMQLTSAKPTGEELRRSFRKLIQVGGVLSLCAGVVFFIAANWDAFGAFGRFAIIQTLLSVAIVVAWASESATMRYRLSTVASFILSGALLALFGQTYQTGADIHELFFIWALLGLPFVVAGRWWAGWAIWLLVLNTALILFCGFVPGQGILWVFFARWNFTPALLVMLTAFANLGLWWLSEQNIAEKVGARSQWLARLAVSFAAMLATWAGVLMIFSSVAPSGSQVLAWIALILFLAIVFVRSLRSKSDVLPLTVGIATVIVLGACTIGNGLSGQDIGTVFLIAVWLIATSTISGRWLTRLHRDWRLDHE